MIKCMLLFLKLKYNYLINLSNNNLNKLKKI